MIKTIKFIKELLSVLKKNSLSYEEVLSVTTSIKPERKTEFINNLPLYLHSIDRRENYTKTLEEEKAENIKKYNQLLKNKVLLDFPEHFYKYAIYHNHYWRDEAQEFQAGLYNSELKLHNLIQYFDKFNDTMSFPLFELTGNSKDKDLALSIDLNGDLKFESFNSRLIQLKRIGFKSNYKETVSVNGVQTAMFSKLHNVSNKDTPEIFAKDFSLLMLAAFYGCDHVIEIFIKKGCDIHYKEPLSGKTALDFYQPIKGINETKRKYIISLLDGTYNNGYYQNIYNAKRSIPTDSVEEGRKYGLYHSTLLNIEQKINKTSQLNLSQEDSVLFEEVFKTSFDKLVIKSQQEETVIKQGKKEDPLLEDTIVALSLKLDSLMEKYGLFQELEEHKETKIIHKQLRASL